MNKSYQPSTYRSMKQRQEITTTEHHYYHIHRQTEICVCVCVCVCVELSIGSTLFFVVVVISIPKNTQYVHLLVELSAAAEAAVHSFSYLTISCLLLSIIFDCSSFCMHYATLSSLLFSKS